MAANFIEMLKLVAIDAIFVVVLALILTPLAQYKRAAFLDPDGTPTAFSLDLAAKDLGLIGDLAERVGLGMPQSQVNLDVIRRASAALGGDSDFSAVAMHLRRERQGATTAGS